VLLNNFIDEEKLKYEITGEVHFLDKRSGTTTQTFGDRLETITFKYYN
jgi:hypothetical protein